MTRRSTTLDQTHFTVDTLGLGRLLLARAILSAGTSRRIWALVYVWGTLVYVYFVSSMGTTGSREHNATIEGRKFAISTRARHVSSQPPPRLTNLLSVSQRFSFPFVAFPNWKFAVLCQNKVWRILFRSGARSQGILYFERFRFWVSDNHSQYSWYLYSWSCLEFNKRS